jgi:hypothetical protein
MALSAQLDLSRPYILYHQEDPGLLLDLLILSGPLDPCSRYHQEGPDHPADPLDRFALLPMY